MDKDVIVPWFLLSQKARWMLHHFPTEIPNNRLADGQIDAFIRLSNSAVTLDGMQIKTDTTAKSKGSNNIAASIIGRKYIM